MCTGKGEATDINISRKQFAFWAGIILAGVGAILAIILMVCCFLIDDYRITEDQAIAIAKEKCPGFSSGTVAVEKGYYGNWEWPETADVVKIPVYYVSFEDDNNEINFMLPLSGEVNSYNNRRTVIINAKTKEVIRIMGELHGNDLIQLQVIEDSLDEDERHIVKGSIERLQVDILGGVSIESVDLAALAEAYTDSSIISYYGDRLDIYVVQTIPSGSDESAPEPYIFVFYGDYLIKYGNLQSQENLILVKKVCMEIYEWNLENSY